MNMAAVVFGASLFLVGVNVYLVSKSRDLQKEMQVSTNQCEKWVKTLEERKKMVSYSESKKPSSLVVQTIIESTEDVSPQESQNKNIENFVSFSHRVQAITHKYEFLLDTALIDKSDRTYLRKLLLRRERLANALALEEKGLDVVEELGSDLSGQLYEVESEIQLVLTDSTDYERYEYLKQRTL